MKVQVTVDITDARRMGIAIEKDGTLRSASRDECREWLLGRLETPLKALDAKVANVKRSFQPSESPGNPQGLG